MAVIQERIKTNLLNLFQGLVIYVEQIGEGKKAGNVEAATPASAVATEETETNKDSPSVEELEKCKEEQEVDDELLTVLGTETVRRINAPFLLDAFIH